MGKTNINYWKRILENPSRSYKKYFQFEKEFLLKNVKGNSMILDVGCGTGIVLSTLWTKTRKLIGVDNDLDAIDFAKKRFKGKSNVSIFLKEAINLDFDSDTFDYIICLSTFVNFDKEKIKILKSMKRVLKKDGRIILSVYNEDAFNERMKMYKEVKAPIEKVVGTKVILEKSFGANISEQFSFEELNRIFEKSQLKPIEIKKEGIGYFCILKK